MGSQVDIIGEHRILERLDGYGREVFLSEREDGSRALLALFAVDDDTAEKLEQTAARCLALADPHLAHVVELFTFNEQRVVVFEDIRGLSLASITQELGKQDTKLTDGALLEIGYSVCRALGAAHTAKGDAGNVVPLVHHQLGPHQVFVSFEGDIRVLGMGLGPIFELQTDLKTLPAMARRYAAPEARRGSLITVRANIFSVAAILWSGLTGEEPPEKGAFTELGKLRPDLPRKLITTIDAALEPVVLRRSVTCKQLADVIEDSGLMSRQELLWNIEILRSDPAISDGVFPLESLPPTSGPDSPPPDSSKTGVYLAQVPSKVQTMTPPGAVMTEPKPEVEEKPPSSRDDSKARRNRLDSVTAPSAGVVLAPKPPPPPRAPLATKQGIASAPPAPAPKVGVRESKARVRGPKKIEPTSVERLKKSRDQLAKRETMRLATNIVPKEKPPALREQLRAPKVPVVETPQVVDEEAAETPRKRKKRPPAKTQEIPEEALQEAASAEAQGVPKSTQEIPQETLDALAAEERRRFPIKTQEIPPPPEEEERISVEIPPQRPVEPIVPSEPSVPAVAPPSEPSPPAPPVEPPAPPVEPPKLRVLAEERGDHGEQIVIVAPPEPGVNWWNVFALVAFVGSVGLAGGLALGRFTGSQRTTPPSEVTAPAPPPQTSLPRPSATATSAPPTTAPSEKPIEPTKVTTVLLIDTEQANAHIYLDGKPLGPVAERVAAPCGVHNLRLGTFPLTRWLSQGKSFHLKCGESLELTLEPFYAGPRLRR